MNDKGTDVVVKHNTEDSRFETSVDGSLAVAQYSLQPGKMVFTHTEVPKEIGGRGIAQQLVTSGLDYARSKGLKVVPLCRYVKTFIERHPEYNDLVS